MPELPEVEVVKRSLINKIQNSIIKAIKINDGRLRYKIDRNQIKKIIGLKFKKISRRSKYLLFFFNKDIVMLVHLGMTGKFFFVNRKSKKFKTPSNTSPKNTKRGCLCPDGKRYSNKCCVGSLQAQGIGKV